MQAIRIFLGSVVVATLVGIPMSAEASQAKAKGTTTVKVKLFEFKVKPKPGSVEAGTVRFKVKNIGTEEHEFVVVKADSALPTASDGSVDEDAIPVAEQFGEVEGLEPKRSGTLKVEALSAGEYVLFCNVVDDEPDGTTLSHYAEGMFADFSVN